MLKYKIYSVYWSGYVWRYDYHENDVYSNSGANYHPPQLFSLLEARCIIRRRTKKTNYIYHIEIDNF